MLDYILTLMGREAQDDNEGFVDSNLELLHTQVYYLVKLLCLGLETCFPLNFCWNSSDFSSFLGCFCRPLL
jgi:hypothetical protein